MCVEGMGNGGGSRARAVLTEGAAGLEDPWPGCWWMGLEAAALVLVRPLLFSVGSCQGAGCAESNLTLPSRPQSHVAKCHILHVSSTSRVGDSNTSLGNATVPQACTAARGRYAPRVVLSIWLC